MNLFENLQYKYVTITQFLSTIVLLYKQKFRTFYNAGNIVPGGSFDSAYMICFS